MSNKKLMDLKRKIKQKKPNFIRQESHKLKRIGNSNKWRKPKGYHSKLKAGKAHRKSVSTGYGVPNEVKHLNPQGLEEVPVSTIEELNRIKKDAQGAVLNSTLGMKKKIQLIEEAEKLGITVCNFKNPKKYAEDYKKSIEEKKQQKKKEEKKTEKKEKKDEKESKESIEDKLTEEEKKKLEKKEIDRLLTKKF